MNLAELWAELDATAPPSTGFVERRLPTAAGCDLYVAVRKPGNRRLVIARVRGADVSHVQLPPPSRGVTSALTAAQGGEGIELSLADATFSGVFDVLIEDLARTLATPSDAQASIDRLLGRLRVWQQFFASADPQGLSFEHLRGLFGELWFLREHLLGAIGSERAIGAWKGQSRTDQDFQLDGCAVEVKTTGTKAPQRLHVASERQLDSTGVRTLLVCHVSVDVREGGGQTLPQLVATIRSHVTTHSVAASDFEDKLLVAGYLDAQADRYRASGFTVRESNLFEVRDEFPRILGPELRPGVGDVRYSILVDMLRPFSVTSGRLRAMILGDGR